MGRVQGKVALVTGGASGIGDAITGLLAEEGASVISADLASRQPDNAASALRQRVSFRILDVRREDDWIAATDAVIDEFGRLDVLVNNAGIALLKDIEATTLEEWRSLMAVNLEGVFLGCKHAIRVMRANGGGSIVNMSSVAGIIGHGGVPAYFAGKGGVRLVSQTGALHFA